MFENITYEEILSRILSRVPSDIDKREGSIIYNAVAPLAVEILLFYNQLNCLLSETYADTASMHYLEKRCGERGIYKNPATKSKISAVFTPSGVDIFDKSFSCGGINFKVISAGLQDDYILECEMSGALGNISSGDLIPNENIGGLTHAEITGILAYGENEEDTEALRSRYFKSLKAEAFSGNISDYIEKVNKISGVGGVKVYPAFSGGGTVKLVILGSNYEKPSAAVLSDVKNMLDPENGNGKGLAPIGHTVSVFGVKNKIISVTFNYSLEANTTYNDLLPFINKVVDDYFCELSSGWADKENLVVRASQLEARLIELDGVIDISSLKINGQSGNIALSDDEIPIRGDVNG